MRLIDAGVLKEWVENWFTKNRFYHPYAKNNNIPIPELYDIIEQMPSAQPDIIMCKGCKHWHSDADAGTACDYTNMAQPEDGFCNWAERKTNAAN